MTHRSRRPLEWALLGSMVLIAAAPAQVTRPAPDQLRKPVSPMIAAKPDLKLEEVWLAQTGPAAGNGAGIRLTGNAPLGGAVRLSARLTNAGAALKAPFIVTYLVDGTVAGAEQIGGLGPGQTTISGVLFQTQAAGAHKLRCEIDRENKIVETTKVNNALETAFTVAGPIGPGRGTAGVVEDKPAREPRTLPGGGSAPTFPADEPPLASISLGGIAVTAIEVPDALGHEFAIIASGSTLNLLKTADLSVIKTVGCDGDIRDQPVTALLVTGDLRTFVGSSAATVYALDPSSMTIIWQRNLRRASCTSDSVTARPLVHLRRSASANYKGRYVTDLVYVSTAYRATAQCTTGHNADNRIFALQATDGLPVWTFNESGTYDVDAIVSGANLDAVNDRLFFTSGRDFTALQSTVWALDLLTGRPAWSSSAGSIENSPGVFDDRLLVASRPGVVSAIDRNTGGLIWRLQVGQAPSPSIARMTAATFPGTGRAACVVMAGGRVQLVKDNGNSGEVVWDITLPGGRKAVSRAVYEPGSNMLYVGADDGQVYQISAASGAVTANRFIDPAGTGLVSDPFIWRAGGVAKLIAGSSTGKIAEYPLPWPTETIGP
jgi:outer membrane protein assembly factor BamB